MSVYLGNQRVSGQGGVTAAWGGIIGTLADQTDLKNALDAKANASDIALQDISSQYTFTKSAGNANISTINAIRSGNYVQLSFSGSYTGQTAKAQNVITGTFSGGPLPAVDSINLGSYYDGGGSVVFLKTTGELIVRAIGDPVGGNGYSFTMSIGFLTND